MKKILIFLLLFVFAIGLCSCGGQEVSTSEDTSDTTEPTKVMKLIADSEGTKYSIIVPKGLDYLKKAAEKLEAASCDATGKCIYVKNDTGTKINEYEILVGLTNREESTSVSQGLGKDEYLIKWQGEKLCVGAGSNYAAKAGVLWLYENYFKDAKDSISIPEDLLERGNSGVNYELKDLKAGWNSLVYPTSNDIEMKCQIRMPNNYDSSKEYPCILYMHSAGVRKYDNEHIYQGEAAFLRNLEAGKYRNDVIVIAPFCPEEDKWVPVNSWKADAYDFANAKPTKHMEGAMELFNLAREKLSIDDSRLYLYGMSMGGFASHYYIARQSGLFAAVITAAGAGDPSAVSNYEGTAVWMFHGTNDSVVPYNSMIRMKEAFDAIGRTDILYTTFEGEDHGIWSKTANTEGLYDWLFSKKR